MWNALWIVSVEIDDLSPGRTAPPRVRGGLVARLAVLVVGLGLFAAGIVAMLEARLGLSPWDVLHQGIARHSPLSFGAATVVVSAGVLVVAMALGARAGAGTVLNAVLVGTFVQAFGGISAVERLAHAPLGARAALLAAGLVLVAVGTALYIGAGLGAGPRDSLMLVGARRSRRRIGLVRGGIELSALALGFALGGTIGVGTLAFAVGIGPLVEAAFRLLARSPLAHRPADTTGVAAVPGSACAAVAVEAR
jgi:uncharacterized membrane protein YczE